MVKRIRENKRLFGFILFFLLLAIIPLFVRSPYYLSLFIMTIINAILAITFIIMLRVGLISLGIAAFWGIGAYTSVMLVMKLNFSFWLSLPLSTLITVLIAWGLGFLLIKNTGFGFVIITAIIGMLFTVTVGNISFLGGYHGIAEIPRPDAIAIPFLPAIEFVSKIQYYYLALFIFIVVTLIVLAFYAAWTGRAWIATGHQPRLAESLGVNIFSYRLLAFVVASGIAGLVGSFYAHYTRFVIPDTFAMFTTIYAQIYGILGGIGYAIMGPFVGAIIMTFFTAFTRSAGEISPMFTGLILVLLIAFLPTGLLSLLDKSSFIDSGLSNIRKSLENILPRRDKTGVL